MAGRRPDLSISIKDASDKESKPIPLAAYWQEGDRLQGGLDRGIAELAIKLDDGTIVRVKRTRDANGKSRTSHYVNAKLWPRERPREDPASEGSWADNLEPRPAPADNWNDAGTDDLPF